LNEISFGSIQDNRIDDEETVSAMTATGVASLNCGSLSLQLSPSSPQFSEES
jgi:hypothetical protein